MKLSSLGEKGLLHLLTAHWKTDRSIQTGTGDDCAVLKIGAKRRLLFKTDAVVEKIHFASNAKPEWIGRKALARAISDIAAMGGRPWAALVTLGVPPRTDSKYLRKIYRGLEKIATQYRVNLVGGETTSSRDLFISIALLGWVDRKPILRSGVKADDEIWVTGKLGGSIKKKHFLFEPRLPEGEWLAKRGIASAMMDLSDGLGADLPRLAAASGLSYEVDEKALPRARGVNIQAAWSDGEDYELLFAVPPQKAKRLKKEWPFAVPITRIGKFLRNKKRKKSPFKKTGYDHLKKR